MADWDPQQYRRFAEERAQAFHDLVAMIQPGSTDRAVDLGCGPGELTALAAKELQVGEMVGIDSSPAMLEKAAEHATSTIHFEYGEIGGWSSPADLDLVLAAASLQWVPDHRRTIGRWA